MKVIQTKGVQTVAMSRSASELLKPVPATTHRHVETRRWRNQMLWALTVSAHPKLKRVVLALNLSNLVLALRTEILWD